MPIKINELPSIEYLNECFLYDEENGVLVWKERPLHHFATYKAYKIWNAKYPNVKVGNKVEVHKNYFQIIVKLLKKNYRVHRLIFKIIHGYDPLYIDHIDGDTLNNKILNLRSVTTKENSKNRSMTKSNGYIGVYFHKGNRNKPWSACIQINRKKYTKYFAIEEEAIFCRKTWNKEHGFHENHGRINNENQT